MDQGPFAPLTDKEKSKKTRSTDRDEWTVVIPVPEDAPEPTFGHAELGEPAHTWEYRSSNRDLLGYVCRFDSEDGKELRPRFLCKGPNGQQAWRWKAPQKPRPLYSPDQLAKKPDAMVLVVEGEKTADAARERFPDLVVVSPMNGAQSPHLADWTPLRDRQVIVWGDHDAAGGEFAQDVARESRNAGCSSVRTVRVPEDFPPKWDLADDLPEALDGSLQTCWMLHRMSPRSQTLSLRSSRTGHARAPARPSSPRFSRP